MRHAIRRTWQARSFIAGVLIGLSIVTPVFAAAGDSDNQWRTLLALGSLVLLFLGLLLEAITNAEPPRKLGPQVMHAESNAHVPQPRPTAARLHEANPPQVA